MDEVFEGLSYIDGSLFTLACPWQIEHQRRKTYLRSMDKELNQSLSSFLVKRPARLREHKMISYDIHWRPRRCIREVLDQHVSSLETDHKTTTDYFEKRLAAI